MVSIVFKIFYMFTSSFSGNFKQMITMETKKNFLFYSGFSCTPKKICRIDKCFVISDCRGFFFSQTIFFFKNWRNDQFFNKILWHLIRPFYICSPQGFFLPEFCISKTCLMTFAYTCTSGQFYSCYNSDYLIELQITT